MIASFLFYFQLGTNHFQFLCFTNKTSFHFAWLTNPENVKRCIILFGPIIIWPKFELSSNNQ